MTTLTATTTTTPVVRSSEAGALWQGHAALTSTTVSTRRIATVSHSHDDDVSSSDINVWSTLPPELVCKVTCFLDAPSLVRLSATNTHFAEICACNQAGWEGLCESLWKTKVHVSVSARASYQQDLLSAKRAYREALQDAVSRQTVTQEEFCYCPETGEGTVWSFRFKESAGTDWTAVDPWYNGLPCRKMVFLSNGQVKQYFELPSSDSDDPEAAAAAHLPGDLFTSQQLRQRQQQQHSALEPHNRLVVPSQLGGGRQAIVVDPPMTMNWRFLTRPMDLPSRPVGSYVRFSVAGRDVPTYSVRRSPTGNWGFVMESCWGLYASFELPSRKKKRGMTPSISTATPRRRRLRRISQGGIWVEMDADEEEEEQHSLYASPPSSPNSSHADELLQDDSCLLVTNDIQWREAFLYNVGAHVLPEGDEATNEFDRAWRTL